MRKRISKHLFRRSVTISLWHKGFIKRIRSIVGGAGDLKVQKRKLEDQRSHMPINLRSQVHPETEMTTRRGAHREKLWFLCNFCLRGSSVKSLLAALSLLLVSSMTSKEEPLNGAVRES